MPNLFGGDPLRADVRLYVDEIDRENGKCILSQNTSVNAEDARKFILEVLSKTGVDDQEFRQAMKDAIYDIKDIHHHEFDYISGIPLKIDVERNIVMNIGPENGRAYIKRIIELVE